MRDSPLGTAGFIWVDISSQQESWYWEMEMKLNFWHSVHGGAAQVGKQKVLEE